MGYPNNCEPFQASVDRQRHYDYMRKTNEAIQYLDERLTSLGQVVSDLMEEQERRTDSGALPAGVTPTDREPDGWVGEFSNDVIGTARLVLDPSHPRAGKAPYTLPVYIGPPPPERAESEEFSYADLAGRLQDAHHQIADLAVELTRARAEVLAEVMRTFEAATPTVVVNGEGSFSATRIAYILNRLSSEGAEQRGPSACM